MRAGAQAGVPDAAARDDRRADRRPRGRLGDPRSATSRSRRSATASCTSRRTRCCKPRRWPAGFLDADGLMARQLRRLPRAHAGPHRRRRHRHRRRRDPRAADRLVPGAAAAAGVAPEDVDDVIFTHLHFDHVGWSTDGERRCSPRASTTATRSTGTTGAAPTPTPETGPGREDFGAIPAPERLAPLADRSRCTTASARDRPRRDAAARARSLAGALHRRARLARRACVLLADAAHNPAQLLSDDWTLGHRRRPRARPARPAPRWRDELRGQRHADRR